MAKEGFFHGGQIHSHRSISLSAGSRRRPVAPSSGLNPLALFAPDHAPTADCF
jgi:hypothetical protein